MQKFADSFRLLDLQDIIQKKNRAFVRFRLFWQKERHGCEGMRWVSMRTKAFPSVGSLPLFA